MKILPYILIPMILLGCSPSQSKSHKFAEKYVKERQEKWKERVEHLPLVTLGTKEEDVLQHLGDPDSKSDSDTIKNWLYGINASVKDGQITEEVLILKIAGGAVVDRRQATGFHQNTADFYKERHK
jgi:hypothetical protein